MLNPDSKHWLFLLPCGCNEAVSMQEYSPTKAKAFKHVYDTQKQRDAAIERGITVVECTGREWLETHVHLHGCKHRAKP